MTPDDAPQTDPAAVAAWLIAKTPGTQALTPAERGDLHEKLTAIITRGRGPLPHPRPAPSIQE